MKIILKKEVKGLGRAGDVKEVSDGYAQNFLFRQGLAEVATEKNIQIIKKQADKKRTEKAATRTKKKK